MSDKPKHLLDTENPSPGAASMPRRASDIENIGVELVSGLLILIGLGLLAFLFVQINSDAAIQAATRGEGSLILAFLDSFGIITPILILVVGILLIRLGLTTRQRNVTAARWADLSMLWLMVALILYGVISFINTGRAAITLTNPNFDVSAAILAVLPLIILLIPLIIARRWLGTILDVIFVGEETLTTRNTRMAWSLLIPTIAVLILVAARPLEKTFITSLTDKRFAGTEAVNFVGLDNYSKLLQVRTDQVSCRRDAETNACQTDDTGGTRWELPPRDVLQAGFRPVATINTGGGMGLTISGTDPDFLESVSNTLYYTIFSVLLELLLGLFVAMVVNSKFSGRGLMRTAMLVPWAIPTVISARLWEVMLRDNQSGIINKVLVDLHVINSSQAWLANPGLQLNALIMVDVWKTAPFMALLLLAGLQTIPADLYEAASVDGASKFRQFFSVTLPLLRPTIAVALVFRTLDALRAFDVFQVLLGRQKLSMATYNHEVLVQAQNGGYASAIGVIIFILIFIFAVIYVRTLGVETE
jgi:trehalose/maltose transport system permease protein